MVDKIDDDTRRILEAERRARSPSGWQGGSTGRGKEFSPSHVKVSDIDLPWASAFVVAFKLSVAFGVIALPVVVVLYLLTA